jgi:hypothetical protein
VGDVSPNGPEHIASDVSASRGSGFRSEKAMRATREKRALPARTGALSMGSHAIPHPFSSLSTQHTDACCIASIPPGCPKAHIHVLGPVPEVDVMAKRPQGLLNVGTLSARMAVLRSCALDI